MGQNTNADRCENVLYLGESGLEFYDVGDSFNGWMCVASAMNCGDKKRFYGELIMKRDSDLTEEEFTKFVKGEDLGYPYVYMVCGNTVIGGEEFIFSDKREYTEEFKSDFNLYGDIEADDVLTQLI